MLAILTTHPIQYQVPLWQALARDGRVFFEVWHLTRHGTEVSHDREFGKAFAWDLNTLEGYPHRFLETVDGATPGSFWKCRLSESLGERLEKSGAKALWIQGWQVAAYWQAVWAAKRAGVEVWLRAESNDLAPTPFWKRGIKRLVLGQFFRRVDRFLYIGTANKRLYQKYDVPEQRLLPAPYAVDNERFKRQADSLRGQRAEIRRQWKIPEDAFCVLFCGKFIPKKRPMDVVAAARLLQAPGSSLPAPSSPLLAPRSALATPGSPLPAPRSAIHLLFVGSGELGPQLRSACHVVFDAEASALSSSLPAPRSLPAASFTGFLNQTEISRAYVVADCLVLPSDYGETWGLVVNEAMASGLPCIVSDQCGCAEDMAPSSTNRLFRCGDIRALARCVADLGECRMETVAGGESLLKVMSLQRSVETAMACYSSAE